MTTVTTSQPAPAATTPPSDARRLFVYAVTPRRGRIDDYVSLALASLRPHAERIIVIACGEPDAATRATLAGLADRVDVRPGGFEPAAYYEALRRNDVAAAGFDEIVLTGDAWFGPTGAFGEVIERMSVRPVHFWEMVENRLGLPRSFPEQGFPAKLEAWTWTVVRPALLTAPAWDAYWTTRRSASEVLSQESDFAGHFRAAGFVGGFAYGVDEFGNDDPALFAPDLLVAAGCPLVKRRGFGLYPPYLHQHAVIGRDVVAVIEASGYPLAPFWQHLARTVPPKALNTNAGMVEILADPPQNESFALRLAVVAHVSEMDQASDLFARLASLPPGFDLIVTTNDGRKAASLNRLFDKRRVEGAAMIDVRVTPSGRGRDMSDFFIACRDVVLGGDYDLVVKISARPMRRKTVNVRRYFRRYQLENLLESPQHVAGIISLFQREPGLGMVFPPTMHIGYATMGRAWGKYRVPAEGLYERLGIEVPFDNISPLAPFGGMWFARPEALRPLARERWLYRDYGKQGRSQYRDLARLQERTVVAAAADLGFHSRTVLTAEHAAISHTALEFKVDQLFSTTRGYPVDSITLLQRAGKTGYGGIVGLSRMYLRLNHRILARVLLPILDGAQWVYSTARALMGDERFMRERDPWRDEDL